MKKYPLVSVVLNVFNEKENIILCLSRIREQDYPQGKIEIIIVDDDSTDNTLILARKFNVKIVRSGYKNRERAKSIGISAAKGELLLLMDADVFLSTRNYVRKSVVLLTEYKNAVAVQSIRWHYRRSDYIVNRYCNLFGISDPTVLFLGKRGALMNTEDELPYKTAVLKKGKDYFVANFTKDTLPTIGAIGYMIRKDMILKTSWKPYFFHMDTAYELVEKGYGVFIMAKFPVEHRYVCSIRQYLGKQYRNITLFLALKKYRKYTYQMTKKKIIVSFMLMTTIVYPLYQSVKGYIKKPDRAWFLHPFFCFIIAFMYSYIILKDKTTKIFLQESS